MFVFSFLMVTCISIFQASASNCPYKWHIVGDSCFYMPDQTAEDFNGALSYCRNQAKTSLAVIESQKENDYIQSRILKYANNKKLLLGIERYNNRFVKVNTKENIGYSNWNSGEPNFSGRREYCAEMLPSGKWNDMHCWYLQHMSFLCKTKAKSFSLHCPGDFEPYRSNGVMKCYLLYTRKLAYIERYGARKVCQSLGAKVASVNSDKEILRTNFIPKTRDGKILLLESYPWLCREMDAKGITKYISCRNDQLEFVCETQASQSKYYLGVAPGSPY